MLACHNSAGFRVGSCEFGSSGRLGSVEFFSLGFEHRVLALLQAARESIWVSSYVVSCNFNRRSDPVTRWVELLRDKVALGRLDVRFLIDAPKKNRHNYDVNSFIIRYFYAHNIACRCWPATSTVHGKLLIIDHASCMIGSHNWATSSVRNPSELSIEVVEPSAVSWARNYFAAAWMKGDRSKALVGLPERADGSYQKHDIR